MADVKHSSREPLNQTAYVVLGLLSYGYPLSGYEIRQWSLRSMGAFYKPPAQSQIYRELANLEARGFVESTSVEQDDNPNKIVFEMTDVGRDGLRLWIEDGLVANVVIKHPLALQASFAHGTDPTNLIDRIEQHIETTMSMLHEIEDLVTGLTGDEGSVLAKATLEWAMKIRQADIAGATETIIELKSLQ